MLANKKRDHRNACNRVRIEGNSVGEKIIERISASSSFSIDLSDNRWKEEFKFGGGYRSARDDHLCLCKRGVDSRRGERRVAVSSHRLYPVN